MDLGLPSLTDAMRVFADNWVYMSPPFVVSLLAALSGVWALMRWQKKCPEKRTPNAYSSFGGPAKAIDPHENVIIPNEQDFQIKLEKFVKDGAEALRVVSDFDFTLTQYWIDGVRGASCYACIRTSGFLPDEYIRRSQALLDKYYPFEIANDLSHAEKSKLMTEWWTSSNDLMVEFGVTRDLIAPAVKMANIALRDGAKEFLTQLNREDIPLLIISAGLADILEQVLENNGVKFNNTEFVANHLNFDENGKMIGIKGPLIHTLNKFEVTPQKNPQHAERKNVILLGDHLGDVGMTNQIEFNEIIRIGFVNVKVEDSLEKFSKAYDVLITNDNDFDFPRWMLKQVANLKSV